MATYSILVPAGARPGRLDGLEAAIPVRNGFRFWALVLPLVYTLAHRLWRPFLVILVLMGALGALAARDLVAHEVVVMIDLLIGLYAGIAASDWIAAAGERKGYTLAGLALGEDEDEAMARFAHRWMAGDATGAGLTAPAAAATATATRASAAPVIGLFPESGGR